jgi:outer membrane protein TolC
MKQIVSRERCTDLSLEEFGVQKPEGMKKTMTAASVWELQRETTRKIPREPSGSGRERRVNGKLRQLARRVTRPLVAALLAATLPGGPFSLGFAQETQNPPLKAPPQPAVQAKPPIPVSLGLAKYNYSRAPRPFPNLIAPYRSTQIPGVDVVNAPRIEQLIHDGKLELGLQDAVELAMENNMDIAVQRYYPWFADTDILRTKGGGSPRGIPSAAVGFSTANIPQLFFDPTVTTSISYDSRITPINNPFISGTGTVTAFSLRSHTAQYNNHYSQGFATGTSLDAFWNNTRASSSSTANFFNPYVQSALTVQLSQQLLNGFGTFANRRNILIANNTRKLADWGFAQQAITTITNTVTAYWELVYAREHVKVQEQAVAVSEKLYNDNKKQLEIGTMAPLDVTRAEAQLATDRGNLIVAQTIQYQNEQILKNAISKDPLARNLLNVEIIPTEMPLAPEAVAAAPSFEDAVKEAFAKRPDLQEQLYNLANAEIAARAAAIALRPTASVFAQYGSQGLAGDSLIRGPNFLASSGIPIVDASGNPVSIAGVGPIFQATQSSTAVGRNRAGFSTAQSQIFHNQFPDYLVGFNLQIPLRNRIAQADNQRAVLTQRQIQAEMQLLKNNALLDVRNTYIALEQDRARVEAASKARELQQQTFDAEQKKYQLGASTVYNVILTQRDLVTAQGTELRALADLVEAKANFERAVGRTLEVNRVTIANAQSGRFERDTLIPGTLHGRVVGTDKLFTDGGR